MDTASIQTPLTLFRNRLVFGFRLEVTARQESDIDVLVISDDFEL